MLPALAAAMLKYTPVLPFPAALAYVFRQRGWKTALPGRLLALLVAAAAAAPFLVDWRQFRLEDIRDNATLIDNSLHPFLIHVYTNLARLASPLMQFKEAVNSGIKNALRVGFAVFLVVILLRFLKRSSAGRLLELWTLVLMCAASSKFNAWYMGVPLPPALFLPERHWLRRLALLITAAQTLSLTFFKQAYILNHFAMILVPVVVVFRQVRKEKSSQQSADGSQ